MYLQEILRGIEFRANHDISVVKIDRITDDSRSVERGSLFIAVKGYSQDGAKYIKDAVKKGAIGVVTEKDFAAPKYITKVLVRDTRSAVSVIADNFYDHPSQKLKMVGITGTNGKTTITYLLENIVKKSGTGPGVIGTINYRLKERVLPAKNTTPGPLELQSILAGMVSDGLAYAIMEVSSHSLAQNRVDRILYDAAIFTNITSDHLDYHKTPENYFKAKARLFDKLRDGGVAILNNDDKKVASLKGSINKKVITYGVKSAADVRAEDVLLSMDESTFTVVAGDTRFRINTKLIGMHNVSNILASVACASAMGIGTPAIREGIESFIFVPGRLETVDMGQPFKVFVDYAHTEDALHNVLGILREVAKKNVITVFGCGGDRDRTKRPLMGIVTCKYSDRVIITSDNPRHENPAAIINEIESGIKRKFSNYEVVVDRHDAIKKALDTASKDDIVLIAGKGHETYQIIKDKVIPFDDRESVRGILKDKYAGKRYSKSNRRETALGRS